MCAPATAAHRAESTPQRGLCGRMVCPGEGSTPVHPSEGSARTVHVACHGRECLATPDTGHGVLGTARWSAMLLGLGTRALDFPERGLSSVCFRLTWRLA